MPCLSFLPPPALSRQSSARFLPTGRSAPYLCKAAIPTSPPPPLIALTREPGKNHSLSKQLTSLSLPTVELPCIKTEHYSTVISKILPNLVQQTSRFLWVILTSPEGAKVYVEAWKNAGMPKGPKIAAVGGATARIVEEGGGKVEWMPKIARGVELGNDLNVRNGGEVLYVTSRRASGELEKVLEQRGVKVVRINGYDTVKNPWDGKERERLGQVGVVTVASPSAVEGWIENVGEEVKWDMPVACIGLTSAERAKKRGFKNVFWPNKPGVEGWMDAVGDAVECYHRKFDK